MTTKKSIVIALGGNAILRPGEKGTFEEQLKNIEVACIQVAQLIVDGHQVVITHGNGPQVGNLLIQNEKCSQDIPPMPLDVCGAESQGLIGYMIQQTLKKILGKLDCHHEIVTLITQVVVDGRDNAFHNPTKPIGPFYSESYAKKIMNERNEKWIEDSGRGWRKVVPSPIPQRIVEAETIKRLIQDGVVVIASGGGGIPVVEESKGVYKGIEAVIDKDLAGMRLARDLNVDIFMILTDVSQVAINYGKHNQEWLDVLSLREAIEYQQQGQFKSGSMGPKVDACIQFVQRTKKIAIITSIDSVLEAIKGNSGTKIFYEPCSYDY